MAYKHGAYGERTASQVKNASVVDENAVYFGTAPINLVRGYDDAGLINTPVRLRNLGDAQAKIGYSDNWAKFTLSEVVDYHFNNTEGNVGPIYVINVLDPDTHRKAAEFPLRRERWCQELLGFRHASTLQLGHERAHTRTERRADQTRPD